MPKYIDADALKEAFLIEGKDVCDDTDEFDTKWGASQELIEKVIDSAPSADVEPKRKSGRWIIAGAFDDFYQCPECGEMWPIFSTIEWKCCPICECKIITNRPKGEAECLFE